MTSSILWVMKMIAIPVFFNPLMIWRSAFFPLR